MTNRYRWLLLPQLGLVIVVSIMAYLDRLPRQWLAWPYSDKVIHFLLFGLVAFWLSFWGQERPASVIKRNGMVLVLSAVIIAEECCQSLSPHRSFDFVDLGCDLAGVMLFWALGRRIRTSGQT